MNPAKCNKDAYTLFLLGEPKRASCTKLAEVMENMSHDAAKNFLCREEFTGHDLFLENKEHIDLENCVVSVDDSIQDKPYSNPLYNDLVKKMFSGLHHKLVKGICIITLLAVDSQRRKLPVNFRVYDPTEKKTKNEYFLEMMEELMQWGFLPKLVTGDCWYGSKENMKFLRNNDINFLFGLKKNRIVSEKIHEHQAIGEIDIPWEGKIVHLTGYGTVRVFCRDFKDDIPKYYCCSVLETSPDDFEITHSKHWTIEKFHRVIKQVCNSEKCMLRHNQGQKNHFYCVLRAFSFLSKQVIQRKIDNWYALTRDLYNKVVKDFIVSYLPNFSNA